MKKPNRSNFQENVDQMSIQQLVFSIVSLGLEIQLFKISVCVHAQSLQLCQMLCNPMDCSSPSSSVNGILQARILEWVALPSSRGFSRPRAQTHSPTSPVLQVEFLPLSHWVSPLNCQVSFKENWEITSFKLEFLRGTFTCEGFLKAVLYFLLKSSQLSVHVHYQYLSTFGYKEKVDNTALE